MDSIVQDTIVELKILADELRNKIRNQQEDGELIAYAEALSIIQSMIPEEDRSKYLIDFDIDKAYLLD